MNNQQFKVVMIGDGGCGKTTFINRLNTGEFEKRYIATMGVEVNFMDMPSSIGNINFSVWDTAGQEKYSGLKLTYYNNADAAIVFFDLTSMITFINVKQWITDFRSKCPGVPIILVGNKCDIRQRKVNRQTIDAFMHTDFIANNNNVTYFNISAKSNYNYDKPFLYLARILTNDNHLVFVEKSPISPLVVTFP